MRLGVVCSREPTMTEKLSPDSINLLSGDILITTGRMAGMTRIKKFGRAIVGTGHTPLSFGGFYRTPTAATALEVVSTDVDDTAAGAGGQQIWAQGLDSNWNYAEQNVELDGTTPVALTTDLIRLFRWGVSRTGVYATQAAASHQGDITIQESGAGDVWSTIDKTGYPRGQSQIGAYTIPAGNTGYVGDIYVTIDTNKVTDVLMLQRPHADDVTTPYTGVMKVVREFIGMATQPPHIANPFLEGPFVGPCDIIFMGLVTVGTASVTVDFELLVEKTI